MERKTVILLIFAMACTVLPGYGRKRKPKEDEAKVRLKLAIEHFQQGSSLYSQKKLDDAIAEYRKALRVDTEEPYWHQALAKALEDKGDLQGALEEYRTASQQSPLDSGLRSKYEELASKLQVNIRAVKAEPKPDKAATVALDLLKLEPGVTPPVPTFRPEPSYSEKAREISYDGTLVLSIVVDVQGNVARASIVKPLGLGFDEKALETVRTWKFKPAKRDTIPIQVQLMVEVSFRGY